MPARARARCVGPVKLRCHRALVTGLLIGLLGTLSGLCAAQRLIVVVSSDGAPYAQALAGISKAGKAVETHTIDPGNPATLQATLAGAGRNAAIVTLGEAAGVFVTESGATAAVVHCMAGERATRRLPAAALVVPRAISIDAKAMWLHRLLPSATKVGILFDPNNDAPVANKAAEGLKRAGFTPVLEPVSEPRELPQALARLSSRIDVLHALPHSMAFAPEHTRALLLYSFRNQVPLAGPTEAWVEAGALYAVDWDYPDLGRYCAALALHQLAGGRAPPPTPPRTRVTVNLRSAEQLRVKWDDTLLRAVDKVVE